MCIHRGEYRDARRTYSDRAPGYAQGAVFPGDEAGNICKLSGEICGKIDDIRPDW